ncbi:MAG: Hint domain-containing protein [Bdellovibrionia bacterium]
MRELMKNSLALTLGLGILLAGTPSYAIFYTPERCAFDSLNQWSHDLDPAHNGTNADAKGTARGRNEWFRVCQPGIYDTVYPTPSGNPTPEFNNEYDPLISKNGSHRRVYATFGIVTGFDSNGQTLFHNNASSGAWVAPTVAAASSGASECAMPSGFKFVGLCTSGCVTPEQEIASPQGDLAIEALEKLETPAVYVPEAGLNGGAFRLSEIPAKRFVKDVTPAQQKVLEVSTLSGAKLRVSPEHPLLTGNMTFSIAQDLKVGQTLIKADGRQDPIVSIQETSYFGKLHNLYVDTARMDQSLYIVQGFVSGDKHYQDVSVSDLNRMALRRLVQVSNK